MVRNIWPPVAAILGAAIRIIVGAGAWLTAVTALGGDNMVVGAVGNWIGFCGKTGVGWGGGAVGAGVATASGAATGAEITKKTR